MLPQIYYYMWSMTRSNIVVDQVTATWRLMVAVADEGVFVWMSDADAFAGMPTAAT